MTLFLRFPLYTRVSHILTVGHLISATALTKFEGGGGGGHLCILCHDVTSGPTQPNPTCQPRQETSPHGNQSSRPASGKNNGKKITNVKCGMQNAKQTARKRGKCDMPFFFFGPRNGCMSRSQPACMPPWLCGDHSSLSCTR